VEPTRAQWSSKLGFILAASGSAIGLGNIVFFGANAYTFGAGAFYLPYLLALFLVGIPVLISELGLGSMTQQGFPSSLGQVGGRWGEFAGWWGLLNASFITMYYITILAWVVGMFLGAFGPLWKAETELPAFSQLGSLANPQGFFFHMLSSWWVLLLVALVWLLNLLIVSRGVQTIEPAVKVFVPLMWIFMVILIVRGVTLPAGEEGVFLLFTPDFGIMKDPAVWQGAVSQIFFSLTLGFGVMTAYASYLPRDADQINNGLVTACMNCGFEFIAGVAIFSLLFTFAIVPQASTLGMMFFVIPQGIAAMPRAVVVFGLIFFLLLLMAGLSSSISLIEGLCCAMIDKFGWPRRQTLAVACLVGVAGSALFALPVVVDSRLAGDGTLGFSLVDLIDHWAFSHGLLIVGLVECLILGWKLPVARLRAHLNRASRFRLPAAFDWLIKLVIPAALAVILGTSIYSKLRGGIYGHDLAFDHLRGLPVAAFVAWLVGSLGVALLFTLKAPAGAASPAGGGARVPETIAGG
jgi:neurotransmitter:Na+ symporter, NSS family